MITEQLKNIYLSAAELKKLTNWPDIVIEDYINLSNNIIIVSQESDIDIDVLDEYANTFLATSSLAAKTKSKVFKLSKLIENIENLDSAKFKSKLNTMSKRIELIENSQSILIGKLKAEINNLKKRVEECEQLIK